ncbi:MAG: hypothetical protein ACOZEN_14335 [Thermodesulfobacteriota bacterium]
MNALSLTALIILIPFFAACAPMKPMTVSEFKGYCYQGGSFSFRSSCDTIRVCDEYLPVVEGERKSLETCLKGCAEVYRQQQRFYGVGECPKEMENAVDWCQRYCRRAFAR